MRLIPINGGRPLPTIQFDDQPNVPAIIYLIAKKNDVLSVQIELFSEGSGAHKINSDEDLRTASTEAIHYKIRDKPCVTFIPLGCATESIDINKVDDVMIIDYFTRQFDVEPLSLKFYMDENKSLKIEDIDDNIRKDYRQRDIYFVLDLIYKNFVENKTLGEGSFGKASKCTDMKSKKIVVLKQVKFKENVDKQMDCIKNTLLSIKSHDRIIKFDKEIDKDDTLYLVLEYMPGGSIGSIIKSGGALKEYQIKKYAKQILEGLHHLHSNNVIHRNIKADNILLDGNDNVKLSEFGFARMMDGNEPVKSTVGSANWMAPEIICGECYDYKVDIWSFGATLVEMITGKKPFHDKNNILVIHLIGMKKEIEFTYPEDSSEEIKDFVGKCLQGDPSKRATVEELLAHPFLRNKD